MKSKSVQGLYHIGHAKWYDLFKKVWNFLVSQKAEKEFTKFLKENIDKNTSILELGCGTALNLEKISSLDLKFKKYLGFDFSTDMLAAAKRKFKDTTNTTFKKQDITKLAGAKGQFDIIISTWVLSHLNSPSEIVDQAQSYLSKNGKLFLIFFSQPVFPLNILFYPFARYLFQCIPVSRKEIAKIKNMQKVKSYALGITTLVLIEDK